VLGAPEPGRSIAIPLELTEEERDQKPGSAQPSGVDSYEEAKAHFDKQFADYFNLFKEGTWFVESEALEGDGPIELKDALRERFGEEVDLDGD